MPCKCQFEEEGHYACHDQDQKYWHWDNSTYNISEAKVDSGFLLHDRKFALTVAFGFRQLLVRCRSSGLCLSLFLNLPSTSDENKPQVREWAEENLIGRNFLPIYSPSWSLAMPAPECSKYLSCLLSKVCLRIANAWPVSFCPIKHCWTISLCMMKEM